MSQTHSSHQHGLHTMNSSRPKSKLRKRANKAKARVRKAELLKEFEIAKAAKNPTKKAVAAKTATKKTPAKKATTTKTATKKAPAKKKAE